MGLWRPIYGVSLRSTPLNLPLVPPFLWLSVLFLLCGPSWEKASRLSGGCHGLYQPGMWRVFVISQKDFVIRIKHLSLKPNQREIQWILDANINWCISCTRIGSSDPHWRTQNDVLTLNTSFSSSLMVMKLRDTHLSESLSFQGLVVNWIKLWKVKPQNDYSLPLLTMRRSPANSKWWTRQWNAWSWRKSYVSLAESSREHLSHHSSH